MRRISLQTFTLFITLSFCNIAAFADDRGTADQAIAMVKKAIANFKVNGKEKALSDFNDPSNKQFHDRDLYVIAFDMEGTMLASANPKLIGKPMMDFKDGDGKLLTKEMLQIAKTKGSGWVEYKWPNPITRTLDQKSTYIEKIDNYFLGVGIYK
ncbi:cache domain-containing protein [Undibacterium sp. TC9W]|jgi:cytochrome c|uniref:cache domain-containing protein n=1 Tax=Undibacterium sp. TC9W TaxID=3413053 RepID=UPI003BF06291